MVPLSSALRKPKAYIGTLGKARLPKPVRQSIAVATALSLIVYGTIIFGFLGMWNIWGFWTMVAFTAITTFVTTYEKENQNLIALKFFRYIRNARSKGITDDGPRITMRRGFANLGRHSARFFRLGNIVIKDSAE